MKIEARQKKEKIASYSIVDDDSRHEPKSIMTTVVSLAIREDIEATLTVAGERLDRYCYLIRNECLEHKRTNKGIPRHFGTIQTTHRTAYMYSIPLPRLSFLWQLIDNPFRRWNKG